MHRLQTFVSKYRYQLGLAVIILIAAFMRFYQLSTLPPGLHSDEAANGLDILRILENHDFRPFYSTNGGREALFFYFQAIGVQIFGATIFGLRVVPAFLGVVAVIMLYVWLNNWFGKRVAIVAGVLLAASPWAITISRDGYRAGLLAIMVPLVLWLYTKAIQTGSLGWYLGAGAAFGLGFYTYPAYWVTPLLLAIFMGYLVVRQRQRARSLITGVAKSLGAAIIILIPLIWYGVQHMGELFGRAHGVSVFSQPNGLVGMIQAVGEGIGKTLLMFHLHGDDNYRHNLGGQPELNVFVGAMLLLGIMLCVAYRKRHHYYVALLAVLMVMLIPAMATTEGIPHALRAYGALPAIVALAALGMLYMVDQWRAVFPLNAPARMLGAGAMVVLLLLTVYQGYTQYFVAWANTSETYEAYQEEAVSLAAYYNTKDFKGKRYAVAGSYEMMPTQFLTHNRSSYQRLTKTQVESLPLDAKSAKEFSVFSDDVARVQPLLERKYPTLKRSPHRSSFDDRELFVIYTVPSL